MELDLSRSAVRRLVRRPGLAAVARLAGSLHRPHAAGRLLVVGTEDYEPWHLVAHLQERHQASTGQPVWVRQVVPDRAPAHLATGLDTLARAGRSDTVLVVAPQRTTDGLLERLCDARRHGSTVLSLAGAGTGLAPLLELSHDTAQVEAPQWDYAQHLLPILR